MKAAVRAAALLRRDALPPPVRLTLSRLITGRILAMEEFARAQAVLAYCGFGSELDTGQLLRAVLASGKTLWLPKVNRAAGRLNVYRVEQLDTQLRAGVWGIREPDPSVCEEGALDRVDLVLVPGVAFDRRGGRLGYGQGYYDRLLAGTANATVVAGAFEVQVVDSVPRELHDIPMQRLVTEAGIFIA